MIWSFKNLESLGVIKSLGLYVRGVCWLHHLENKAIKNSFRKLRGEKCHAHAKNSATVPSNAIL